MWLVSRGCQNCGRVLHSSAVWQVLQPLAPVGMQLRTQSADKFPLVSARHVLFPLALPWACAGKDWSLDADFEGAGQQVQRGYLSMLAVDSLLAFMGSVEKLVDIAVEQGGQISPALSKGPGSGGWAGGRAALGRQVERRGVKPAIWRPARCLVPRPLQASAVCSG